MKIGILTFHQSVNNGAVLQAYALSKRIQKEYPNSTVEIIDYQMKKVNESYSYTLRSYLRNSSVKVFLWKCRHLLRNPYYLRRLRMRTNIFKNCLYKLPLSDTRIEDDEPDKLIQYVNENYDILVVGSDAIWNHTFRGFPSAYLPDHRVTCKKLSYAASCYGMDFLKCDENVREQIGNNLNDFCFIGVRDNATAGFVQWSGCESKPVHTCDPTVFLDVDDLPIDEENLREKMAKRGFDFSKPAIAIMGNQSILQMVRRFYGNQYQIVALYEYLNGADVNLYDIEPYEWASVFRYFKMTYTTYFHGTLLSLRNGVPVICLALQTEFAKKHTPKTLDVLQRLGFEDWYFQTDYMNENIERIKEKSDDFLLSDYKEKIITAMDREADSFENFNKTLKKILG